MIHEWRVLPVDTAVEEGRKGGRRMVRLRWCVLLATTAAMYRSV